MFLSIKKHMDESSPELTAALLQLSQLLLRSMRLHVVRGEEAEVLRFQSSILALEQHIGSSPDPADVLVIAGEAARTFEDYYHQTNRFLHLQSNELAAMIGMLTATVSSISMASQTAVEQLGKVEKRIENISYASDLPRLKAELAGCLAMVREESFRQREESARRIHSLQRGVSDSRQRLSGALPGPMEMPLLPLMHDALTGLPGRADAEDALYRARVQENLYAAVLPVDRLPLVNTRFGSESTDHVVRFYAEYWKKHLHMKDLLFRWSSNAFLALIERTQPQDTVRADLSKFASAKLEMTLEHHGREILLPLSSTWALFPAGEGRTHEAMLTKIDAFLKSEMHIKDSF
ncbi:MAG: diguanylate cyclase [Acidobacteria bacterium]|nr:diguanylate cyclase [Acidobacteriota bacterium]